MVLFVVAQRSGSMIREVEERGFFFKKKKNHAIKEWSFNLNIKILIPTVLNRSFYFNSYLVINNVKCIDIIFFKVMKL